MPEKPVCQICGRTSPEVEMIPAAVIREALEDIIRAHHPDWQDSSYICLEDLDRYRDEYFESIMEKEKGELTSLEEEVVESLQDREIISTNVEEDFETKLSFGDKLSDKLAEFGGSWRFIIIFGAILLGWIAINTLVMLKRPFDPYPFILLNLVLSCLAAIQAPIIMMSQNRQEAKDRLRSEHDYQVNLKSELEIRNLHQKVDHLLNHQWERLMEIQQVQMEMLQEVNKIERN